MSASQYFSTDYTAARRRFRDAATAAGARLAARENPGRGPAGETLATDAALFGPAEAERAVVAISGTHGVEGYCGSGAQVGWLESGLWRERPPGTALLLIHAINPHGFAWNRRVTEDNVDLNRNFVDFDGPLPANPGYDALHPAVLPADWSEASLAAAQALLDAYGAEHGAAALQAALSGGQYSHPDGIFYGGRAPTWSHRTLVELLRVHLPSARHVAVVDFHTGLGPYGYGEPICVAAPDSEAGRRAVAWYGDSVTFPSAGTSTSAPLNGTNDIGVRRALPQAAVTMVALEYGTLPLEQVLLALRADNWLHHRGTLDSDEGRAIKAQVREAFYQDKDDWKAMIWARAEEILRKATAGVSES